MQYQVIAFWKLKKIFSVTCINVVKENKLYIVTSLLAKYVAI